MAKVAVGLPTYNRPEFLRQAIESILKQTYRDFELLISDNASPNPATREICEDYVAADPRVKYVRQKTNIGVFNNFQFVYERASAPYFMWASDDDLWEPEFIERGVQALDSDRTKSAWFCQFDRIDDAGTVIETMKPVTAHASKGKKRREVAHYLLEVDNNATKVMFTYSLFRREALREAVDIVLKCQHMKSVDNVFIYAFVCRHDLAADPATLFHKRRHLHEPQSRVRMPKSVLNNRHFSGYRQAAAGTPYALMTNVLLPIRYCIHVYENMRRSIRKRTGRLKKS